MNKRCARCEFFARGFGVENSTGGDDRQSRIFAEKLQDLCGTAQKRRAAPDSKPIRLHVALGTATALSVLFIQPTPFLALFVAVAAATATGGRLEVDRRS